MYFAAYFCSFKGGQTSSIKRGILPKSLKSGARAPYTPGSYIHAHMYFCSCAFTSILLSVVHVHTHTLLQEYLKLCAHESGSVRLRSQTGTDRPTVHTGSNLSAPVWLHYPYQRGTDKKNGAVWLRSIWLPCEPTDRIQKKVQIGMRLILYTKEA